MKKTVMFCLVFLCISACACFANGYKILGVKSTKATGMGEAFIVQADNPTAIAFNPAGITQLKGTQATVDGTLTTSWTKHISPEGDEQDMIGKWHLVPGIFLTSDLGMKNFAVGLGVTVPNGISTEWPSESFARYVATFSDLRVIDINPSAAYKFNEHFSIGGGLSFYYSESVADNRTDYGQLIGAPGKMDGKNHMKGKGYGWGYNCGGIFKLNDRHSFAATFKSPYKITYKGKTELSSIPAVLGMGTFIESDVESSLKFPAVVVVGYAFHPTDRLKLEFNLDWTRWDTVKTVGMRFSDSSLTDAEFKYDYNNTFAYKTGLEYLFTDTFRLRGGYIFNEKAVPENTWRPSLVDTDTHFICSGFGWDIGKFTLDGACQVIIYADRTIDNNVDNNETISSSTIDGKYETFAIGFSLSLSYRF
ncbi:MAG: outer membrane protein transport protein [Candidatus Omnitrophota bacterium]